MTAATGIYIAVIGVSILAVVAAYVVWKRLGGDV